MNSFSNKHRYFVQFMLSNGSVTYEDALNFLQGCSGEQTSLAHLKSLIIEINRAIVNQSYKISLATCEKTDRNMVVWVNLRNDELSRMQSGFSPLELEYFHVTMREILNSDDYSITYARCINLSSTLTGTITRENGEKALQKWIRGGYFVKVEGAVFLGVRTLLEFTSYLKIHVNNCICNLCSEVVISGLTCQSCNKNFHNYCIRKYQQNQNSCPSCKNKWHTSKQNTTETDVELESSQEERV